MCWKQDILDNYKHLISPDHNVGMEHDEGWKELTDGLLASISMFVELLDEPPVQILQIKEKFGALCVYYRGGGEKTKQAVIDAYYASMKKCEICGTVENVGYTAGWTKTCCKTCHDTSSSDRIRYRNWIPNEKEDESIQDIT